MNFRTLEAFYWINRLGSFHAAARHLRTSQAAISVRIAALEREIGVRLFDRVRDGVRPTAKGDELLPHAAKLLTLASDIQLIGRTDALSGRVRFGATSIHALTWIPDLLRRVAAETPGVVVEVAIDTSETLQDLMRRGRLDVALLAGPLEDGAANAQPVGPIPNVWVASPQLGLRAGPCTAASLAAHPIISDRPGSRLHSAVLSWFRAERLELETQHSASNLPTRLHLAQQGLGVAIAGRAASMPHVRQGTLVLLETERPAPSLDYVLACADMISPAARQVLDLATELIRQKPDLDAYFIEASITRR